MHYPQLQSCFSFNFSYEKSKVPDLTWPARILPTSKHCESTPTLRFSHARKTCFQAQLTCMEMEEGLVGLYQAPEGRRGGERCRGCWGGGLDRRRLSQTGVSGGGDRAGAS